MPTEPPTTHERPASVDPPSDTGTSTTDSESDDEDFDPVANDRESLMDEDLGQDYHDAIGASGGVGSPDVDRNAGENATKYYRDYHLELDGT